MKKINNNDKYIVDYYDDELFDDLDIEDTDNNQVEEEINKLEEASISNEIRTLDELISIFELE